MDKDYLQQTVTDNNLLREIFLVLKKHIILFLAIIVASCIVGCAYAFTRDPEYIAEEQVLFSMGEGVEIANDVNTMNAYKATVESFAKQGVVVDRANYYAKLYFNEMRSEDYTLEKFIEEIEYMERQASFYRETLSFFDKIEKLNIELKEDNLTTELRTYKEVEKASCFQRIDLLNQIAEKHAELHAEKLKDSPERSKLISLENEIKRLNKLLIEAKKLNLVDKEDASYDEMTQTQMDLEKARLNAALDLLAQDPGFYPLDKESKVELHNPNDHSYINVGSIGISYTSREEKTFVFGISYTDSSESLAKDNVKILTLAFNIETSYFFTNMNAKIDDLGLKSCNVDVSKSTIVLLAGVVGVVLAVLAVYAIYIFDKTIKTKEEAERLTGFPVLACIEQQEVK